MNPAPHTEPEDLWPSADIETCERRGWAGRHRLVTAMVIGALVAAVLSSEGLAEDRLFVGASLVPALNAAPANPVQASA